jgi:hypothetical protein
MAEKQHITLFATAAEELFNEIETERDGDDDSVIPQTEE